MGTTGLPEGDLTPEVEELQGREPPPLAPIVPVEICGPARVQRLPNPGFAVRQVGLVQGGDPQKLVKTELTRARVTIRAVTGDVYVAPSRAEAFAQIGLLPAGAPPLVLETTAAIWVYTTAAAATVVAHSEHWTN